MTLSLERLSSRMRRGEDIPLRETAQVVLALSVPSILQQMVVTAMEYIDAAMVGHIGAEYGKNDFQQKRNGGNQHWEDASAPAERMDHRGRYT